VPIDGFHFQNHNSWFPLAALRRVSKSQMANAVPAYVVLVSRLRQIGKLHASDGLAALHENAKPKKL